MTISSFQATGPSCISFGEVTRKLARNRSNILLIFVPIGIFAANTNYSDTIVFTLNCLAMIGLANVLCRATDDVASYMGEGAGALLNITMGNATEVVLFHALLHGQYMIVRTPFLGSIIVNLLLVLGLAMFVGEVQHRGQTYNILATRAAACLLSLITTTLLVPVSLFSTLRTLTNRKHVARHILNFSRAISIVLFLVYLIYLASQFRSSRFAYKSLIRLDPSSPTQPEVFQIIDLGHAVREHSRSFSYTADPKTWPILLLTFTTGLISFCGKYLVESIDHLVDHSPLSTTIGLIILPIVGNAAELVSTMMFASRKQINLAFAISIGSAIQIALFVTPLVVILGWILGRDMALHVSIFEAISLIGSTVLFFSLAIDEKCSHRKGALLTTGYTIIA
ncbi:hypothetical protein CC78DRAFT_476170 [Lojkania enalia]|uniref:Vacuolar calcium ion transporter n=1 Tax=Lojkania enalia TaxID=147567 RepID=A0A9P4MYG0_9PLEO|nr:hypothetical protein CC78DRAFT_476170 [Didymosphaeria enalia]